MAAEGAAETAARLTAALGERYVIEREIGQGGMATVYLARDRKHERPVALKVLRPELASRLGAERFLNEIRIAAQLDHPHILTLIDSGDAGGVLYYVMPYVRGESLRQRLRAQGPLGLEEALRIVGQVASALDFAHQQGVIHRDIKPENILLQDGIAMLADFGIALAVKEAGGQRLTETGMYLGTPQYMSPEQAMGERALDARSDVYSLAAVLYEMLAGDPPHVGSTAQAVIAKLVVERPTKLRVLRQTVPVGVEEAVAQGLAKMPADRYATAGEFARALTAGAAGKRPLHRRVLARRIALGALALVAVGGAGVGAIRIARLGGPRAGVALHDRTQLTSTGRVRQAAISPDGRQVAYTTRACESAGCSRALEIANVDGSGRRRLLDSALAIDWISWSPDRGNLIVAGTIAGRVGSAVISSLSGAVRHVSDGSAAFFANGDSLILAPPLARDSVYWIRVAATDGVARDSFRVEGPADGILGVQAVPGTPWFIVGVLRLPVVELRVVDRRGHVRDRRAIETDGLVRVSHDAAWWGDRHSPSLLRLPLDPRRGRFSTTVDTVSSGNFSYFDVTADGGVLVADGSFRERDLFAVGFRDLIRGDLPAARRLLHNVTAPLAAVISPDGERLLVLSASAALSTSSLYTIPFTGGIESPIVSRGSIQTIRWADAANVALMEVEGGKTRFVLVHARTGQRREELAITGPVAEDAFSPLPGGGWAWIPGDQMSIRVQRPGGGPPRIVPKPSWNSMLTALAVSPDGRRLAFLGYNAKMDSLRLSVIDVANGDAVLWCVVAESMWLQWLDDGSVLVVASEGAQGHAIYRVRGPQQVERIGRVAPADGILLGLTFSNDLQRAAMLVGYARSDAWMWRVSRP